MLGLETVAIIGPPERRWGGGHGTEFEKHTDQQEPRYTILKAIQILHWETFQDVFVTLLSFQVSGVIRSMCF